ILVQLGLYNAMNDSATTVHRNLNADLVMLPKDFEYFGSSQVFARVRLMQAASVDGVIDVTPLYAGIVGFKNVDTGGVRSILAIGIEPDHDILDLPEISEQEDKLKISGRILFD